MGRQTTAWDSIRSELRRRACSGISNPIRSPVNRDREDESALEEPYMTCDEIASKVGLPDEIIAGLTRSRKLRHLKVTGGPAYYRLSLVVADLRSLELQSVHRGR